MKFASAITRERDTRRAAQLLVDELGCQFDEPVDFSTLFFTSHHVEGILDVLDAVGAGLSPRHIIGCSGEGVIGADQEIERQPGMSLIAGLLPGTTLQPFHLDSGDWRPLLKDPSKLNVLIRPRLDTRAILAIGDPYTTPVHDALSLLGEAAPGCPIVGGMASGGGHGQNILICNERIHTTGLVGMTISGQVRIDTVVSQGCRPVGERMMVTRSDGNMIEQIGGKKALLVAMDLIESLDPGDQALLENGLYLGIAVNEYQDQFERGDFLVRNLWADEESGAISVGEPVSVGQTIRFHLRDASTADEDLRILMKRQGTGHPPAGGLLFSCNGRGTRLFKRNGHDIMAVLDSVPTTPLAGFFAAGEFGPVRGSNFIHGHTASVMLFREVQ